MNSSIDLKQKTALIHESVPAKGITCSNRERVLRLAKNLNNRRKIKSSWGTFVIIGESESIGEEIHNLEKTFFEIIVTALSKV
ncbi:MAG: hypothetical protein AB4368_33450 [Xenococcaceae cyanobacterium]